MQWLLGPLMVIFVISSLFLILIVLVQTSRGGGLSGMFGGGSDSSAFGTQTGSLLGRLTVIAATTFMVTALAYGLISKGGTPAPAAEAQPAADLGDDLNKALPLTLPESPK